MQAEHTLPQIADEHNEEQEAFRALLDLTSPRGRSRTSPISGDVLVRHAIAVSEGGDWPVQRAALDALLRRLDSARKEGLRVASRPPRGVILGTYTTQRGKRMGGQRPYTTVLQGVDPPAGSCGCPDFRKSALGLCKHLLALLDQVYSGPRKLALALTQQPCFGPRGGPARLCFDPVRPMTGPGDWLLQVRWLPGGGGAGLAERRVRRHFQEAGYAGWSLREAHPDEPRRRLALVRDLIELSEQAEEPYHDPALQAFLADEEARLARRVQDLALGASPERHIEDLQRPLYPYQVEGVARLLRSGRLLLADDMGLGKTAQAIAACHALYSAGRVRRGLLCVPASLKPQWVREWMLFSALPVQMVDGTREMREAIYEKTQQGFLIINYEQLLRDMDLVQGFGADLVVLDEAQRIKNWATKTAASIKSLDPPYRLVLTGTPMENRLEELASIMDWVDPAAIEPKWRLTPWHTRAGDEHEHGGARNLDTLRARLAPSMIRRVRKEVLAQLPPRTDTRVPVEMTPQQRDEHDELYLPIRRLISIMKVRPLRVEEHLRLMSLLNTQRILCNGVGQLHFAEVWPAISGVEAREPTQRAGLFMPKLEALRELLQQVVVGQGRKVVIFSQWRRMLTLAHWAVRDVLQEAGARGVWFTGAENTARRTQNLVEFHDDPDAAVMWLTDAGGVGLNLQRAASCCVNLELPWNPAVLEQRIGRIYRLGQARPIDVYNLVTEGGIESRIAVLLGSKKALFTGLFDGTSNEVCYSQGQSFLHRVEQLIPEAVAQEAEGDPAEDTEDALMDREIDALLCSADEERDEGALRQAAEEAVHLAPPGGQPGAGAAQEDAGGESAEPVVSPTGVEREPASPPPPAPLVGEQAEMVRRLFSDVRVARTQDGGLMLTAPPAAAEVLAALLGGVAQLLAGAAGPPVADHAAPSSR